MQSSFVKISVIIPTLNEAAFIERTVRSVCAQPGPKEIIVADGGSTDDTAALAHAHAAVVRSRRGRAAQMNAGARQASGDVLLFLHADTLLPPNAFAGIRQTLADPGAEAGIFRLRFDLDTPLLRFYSLWTHLPTPLLCFGDRGLFVRHSAFQALGSFPEWDMFEDLELARLLAARGGLRYLAQAVTTSARRFQRYGPLRQQWLNTRLWLRYVLGLAPNKLGERYTYPG